MDTFRIRSGWFVGVLFVISAAGQVALADVSSQFTGFVASDNEMLISGLQSSYDYSTLGSNHNPTNAMFTLGGANGLSGVSYPDSVGEVPSPGYYDPGTASYFDEGMMGVQVAGSNLVVRVASTLNPATGLNYSGWNTTYGVGDVFLTTKNAAGTIQQFALMNVWANNPTTGTSVGSGTFDPAMNFHAGLVGHVVSLTDSSQVALIGGPGSYDGYNVAGLDSRVFAQGGTDEGGTADDLTISTTQDQVFPGTGPDGTWYIETWTVPIAAFSSGTSFEVGLHQTFSCGNDQIGLLADIGGGSATPANGGPVVPVPGAIGLAAIGLCCLRLGKRVFGFDARRTAK